MRRKKNLYSVGDLFVELNDELTPVTGIITKVEYSSYEEQYFYYIRWSDIDIDVTINEAILHWRVGNNIWTYYKVIN